jgi:plasmid maintenance system antidote protein VapI
MLENITHIIGIHPGIILDRELKNRSLAKGRFSLTINEYPQTIVSITKGKRKMNTSLALKIEHELGIEEGYFMMLQVYYDIKQIKQKSFKKTPDLNKLRPILFWDTDISKIDWAKQKNAIIKRVFERGNIEEKQLISEFYGVENAN